MKVATLLPVIVLLLACPAIMAQAQPEYPKVEVFGGYSLEYLGLPDSDLNDIKSALVDLGATSASSSKWIKTGFATSFTYNFTKTIGIEGDVRWNRGNIITAQLSGASASARYTDLPVLFGPRFAFRGNSRAIPFVHVLFGYDHAQISGSGSASGQNISVGGPSSNGFGLAAGGGLDVRVSKLIAIRVIQAD